MNRRDIKSKKYETIINLPIEELKNLLEISISFKNFYDQFFKCPPSKKYHLKILEHFKENNLNTDHFLGTRANRFKNAKYSIEELFTINEKDRVQTVLKRIKRDKLIEYKCQKCDNEGFWLNEKLTLHLDHINGNNLDNRLENLRFLCPNCHQQTDTWGIAKSRRINISDEEFFEMSKTMRNCEIAELLNIDPSTVSNRIGKFYRK